MALKDRFDKLISYFDTDDVSDAEETVQENPTSRGEQQPQRQPEPQRPVRQQAQSVQQRPQQEVPRQRPQVQQQFSASARRTDENVHQLNQHIAPQAVRQEQLTTTIALKYPKKYEDAQEIVDLLIENECVLIDFQYMLDAQARRCIDFIDGASRVLYGNIKKVSSSMYLLTPSNVVVDIDELSVPNAGQDLGFDFDMKRR